MLYNIVLASVIHQHESATGIHMFPPSSASLSPATSSYPLRLSQSTGLSSLCQTADSHWLSFLHREGNGSPLQYSCLENPMDGGAWWAAVHGVEKSQTRLHFHFHFSLPCIGEGKWQPTPVFLPGESQGRGHTESDMTEVT